MKNKDKKKPGQKKEVKRPANKKPRPKKYVEAKVPELPPVSAEQITVTKETPMVEAPKTKTITIQLELPDGQTEAQFMNSVLVAVEQLKIDADKTQKKFKKETSYPFSSIKYGDRDVGLIRRRSEFSLNPELPLKEAYQELKTMYVKMLNEEKPADGPMKDWEWVPSTNFFRKFAQLQPKNLVPPVAPKKSWYDWLLNAFRRKIK